MITEEEVMRLFERADPAGSGHRAPPTDAATYLDVLRTRGVTLLPTDERPAPVDDHPTPTESTRRHRRWMIPVAVAAAVAILGGALAVIVRDGDQAPRGTMSADESEAPTTTTDAPDVEHAGVGLFGLPPRDASPSAPPTGELVAATFGRSPRRYVFIYADGRVIWNELGPVPELGEPLTDMSSTGWLEQRLTPQGVELVRSDIISTGLLDPDRPPHTTGAESHIYVQVRTGDGLVDFGDGDPDWTTGPQQVHRRLTELWTWLPPSAWADREVRAWVPSTYVVCLHEQTSTEGPRALADPAGVVATLPAPAPELLRGARQLSTDDPAYLQHTGRHPCLYEVTTEAARTLVGTFDAAGLRASTIRDAAGLHQIPGWLHFSFEAPPTVVEKYSTVIIDVRPQLPHGAAASAGL